MFYVELNGSGVKNSGFFILESVMVLSVVKCTNKYSFNYQDKSSIGKGPSILLCWIISVEWPTNFEFAATFSIVD